MNAQALDRHMADDEIVRLLDAEEEMPDAAILRAHLAACPQCSARQSVLDRRSRNLSVLLAASDPAMPVMRTPGGSETGVIDIARARRRPPSMPPWLRAAAILAAVVSAALMAPPVRAWLAERVRIFGDDRAAPEASMPASPTPSSVSFVPAGAVLTVDVAGVTGGAELRFVAATSSEVSARSLAAGAAEMFVLSSGLRLESSADEMVFEVSVPASVMRIRVAGVAGESVDVDVAGLPRTLELPVR